MPPHKGIALVKTNELGSVRLKRVIDISSSLISSGWSMAHWLSNTDPSTGDGRWHCSPALKSITGTKATLKCHDWFTQSIQSTAVAFPFTGVQSRRESTPAVWAAESAAGETFNFTAQCENEWKITKYITFLKLTQYNLLTDSFAVMVIYDGRWL